VLTQRFDDNAYELLEGDAVQWEAHLGGNRELKHVIHVFDGLLVADEHARDISHASTEVRPLLGSVASISIIDKAQRIRALA
jgi:hypothetical protein